MTEHVFSLEADPAAVSAATDTNLKIDVVETTLSEAGDAVLNVIREIDRDLAKAARRMADKKLAEMPEADRRAILDDPEKLAQFMARLVDINPAIVTNTEIIANIALLNELRSARKQLEAAAGMVQDATKLVVSTVISMASGGAM